MEAASSRERVTVSGSKLTSENNHAYVRVCRWPQVQHRTPHRELASDPLGPGARESYICYPTPARTKGQLLGCRKERPGL